MPEQVTEIIPNCLGPRFQLPTIEFMNKMQPLRRYSVVLISLINFSYEAKFFEEDL